MIEKLNSHLGWRDNIKKCKEKIYLFENHLLKKKKGNMVILDPKLSPKY